MTCSAVKNTPDRGGQSCTCGKYSPVPTAVMVKSWLPKRSNDDMFVSGIAMATPCTLPMNGRSSGKKLVTISADARTAGGPRMIVNRSVPIAWMRSTTSCSAPLPIAINATTEATPMMMPSMVSRVRSRLWTSDRNAIFNDSPRTATSALVSSLVLAVCICLTASTFCCCSSDVMRPSTI